MVERSKNFDEIKEIFAGGDDNCDKYRGYYKAKYNSDTRMSDDDIIDMVARSEDDDEPDGWANTMKQYEDNFLTAATADAPVTTETAASQA